MSARSGRLAPGVLLLGAFVPTGLRADKEPALTAEDKKYLDGLMKEFLFDPKGAERVTVKTVSRSVSGHADDSPTGGSSRGRTVKRGASTSPTAARSRRRTKRR